MACDECGKELSVGDWPFCKGDPKEHSPIRGGMLGGFKAYYDEDVAPPPSDVFQPAFATDYVEGKGYHITSLRDRQKLMKITHADYGR